MIVYRVYFPVNNPDLIRACHDYNTVEAATEFARSRHGAVVRKLTITTKKRVVHGWSWALIQLAKGKRVRRLEWRAGHLELSKDSSKLLWGSSLFDLFSPELKDLAAETDWVLA